MNSGQLKTHLSQHYDLICFEPLADYNLDTARLYQLFASHHRDRFEPNQRLVLYTSTVPSTQLIKQIERAADKVDISRCFVLLCGNVIDQKNGMEFFQTQIHDQDLSPDNLINLQTFCPLPFFHLAVMNRGRAKACCVFDKTIGSVTESTLDQIFYSEPMSQLRKKFLQGEKDPACAHCWKLEDNNIKSNRQWHLDFYETQMFTENWINDVQLRSLDYRPGNVCNFKCRICAPAASSLFAQETLKFETNYEKSIQLKNIIVEGKWFNDNPDFFEQMKKLLPNMVQIDFYGGEPFMLKQLKELLVFACELGRAKHLRLHFNTNGSIWPEELLPLLSQFREVDLGFSIDNVQDRFEFERGGSWSEVEQNIIKFKSLRDPFKVTITPTVNIQNVLYLPDIIAWANNHNFPLLFNYLDRPEYMNIDRLTDRAKQLVVERLSKCDHPELQSIQRRISQSAGSDGKEFVDSMKQFDSYRSQNFAVSHQDIAIAMGYVL